MHFRFVDVTDTDLTQFLKEQENPKTKRKTAYIELFRGFIQTVNQCRFTRFRTTSIHNISPTAKSLNKLLSKFIYGVRKKTKKFQRFSFKSPAISKVSLFSKMFSSECQWLRSKQNKRT